MSNEYLPSLPHDDFHVNPKKYYESMDKKEQEYRKLAKEKQLKTLSMNKSFSVNTLYYHWVTETPIEYEGQKYNIGKMSYGDYFMEPSGKGGGETSPFASGTKWLKRDTEKKDCYQIDKLLS